MTTSIKQYQLLNVRMGEDETRAIQPDLSVDTFGEGFLTEDELLTEVSKQIHNLQKCENNKLPDQWQVIVTKCLY